MIMSSDQARQMLDRLRREIAAFDRCSARLNQDQREHVTALRIRRNLVLGLLMVRAIERPKKIVNLAVWRWGFAPRATMLRCGIGHGDIAKDSACGTGASGASVTLKPPRRYAGDDAGRDHDDDPLAPEAG